MRSRNGNRSLLFASLSLIGPLCAGADHYYIGYRFASRDASAVSEELSVSRAMQPCTGRKHDSLILPVPSSEPIEHTLNREKERFIDFASSDELRIASTEQILPGHVRSRQTLTLPTRCYAVEFNDASVTITYIK